MSSKNLIAELNLAVGEGYLAQIRYSASGSEASYNQKTQVIFLIRVVPLGGELT